MTTANCGTAPLVDVTGFNKIVNGAPATQGEFPYQVLVAPIISGTQFQCGGSIIKTNWILTAAHCFFFDGVKASSVSVLAGDINQNSLTDLPVSSFITHENFGNEPTRLINDVAVIELSSPITFSERLQPICLALESDINFSGLAVATGWGALSEGGSTSEILQEVALNLITTDSCSNTANLPDDQNQVVCALTPTKDTCQGDSGGPLVVQLCDNRWVQIGITSYGVGCARPDNPGVYAKVPFFIDWIKMEEEVEKELEEVVVWKDEYGKLSIGQDTLSFSPPLYQQRYLKVKEIVMNYASKGKVTKLVDLGCSQMKFFRHLMHIAELQEVVLVDKDQDVLEKHMNWINPRASDWLFLRRKPLHVSVVCGDATIPHPILHHTHAVTLIEVVEHLILSDVESLVRCVFGQVRPYLAVITTPNSDFNQYFPAFKSGSFRHWDHKFEWTGTEFRDWCDGIVLEYSDYRYEMSGCGRGPNNIHCTQLATFIRHGESNTITPPLSPSSLLTTTTTTTSQHIDNTTHLISATQHTDNTLTPPSLTTNTSSQHIDNTQHLNTLITTTPSPPQHTDNNTQHLNTPTTTTSPQHTDNNTQHHLNTLTTNTPQHTDNNTQHPNSLIITSTSTTTTTSSSTYRVLAEYDYPYDRRTQEERDRDEVYARFFPLRTRLIENLWAAGGGGDDAGSVRTAALPPPLASLSAQDDDEERTTKFRVVYLPSEDLLGGGGNDEKNNNVERDLNCVDITGDEENTNFFACGLNGVDITGNDEKNIATGDEKKNNVERDLNCTDNCTENNDDANMNNDENGAGNDNNKNTYDESTTENAYTFYIINQTYAVLPMTSMLAWMNYSTNHTLTSTAIRLTLAEECFETQDNEHEWKGKIMLCDDDNDDDSDSDDGGDLLYSPVGPTGDLYRENGNFEPEDVTNSLNNYLKKFGYDIRMVKQKINLADQLKSGKTKLRHTQTKVKNSDGLTTTHELLPDGTTRVYDDATPGIGYVVDMKPDLTYCLVLPGLMLGSQDVAHDFKILTDNKVTHIINVAAGVINFFEDDFIYKTFEAYDKPTHRLINIFDECCEIIHTTISSGGCVLVHCIAGISRSTTIIAAYLIKHHNMNPNEAVTFIKEKRPFVNPNSGFIHQLHEYYENITQG
ncbi:hypothetical protein Pmani_018927 [Petrolisthes manimaculis]|uniref:limulus clotting factor C n=1 Tax=Petrolisthes manimaculis TaxID=1843537 RepID=A0AAE1PLH3_9EUCA|nr:hypothetical protein Pmani_018927 [Petrolisthes manimaculis]